MNRLRMNPYSKYSVKKHFPLLLRWIWEGATCDPLPLLRVTPLCYGLGEDCLSVPRGTLNDNAGHLFGA